MNTVLLIPALAPDGRLRRVVEGCRALGLERALVVDDGSGEACRPVFDELEALGVEVLRHETNRGKGAALKTGLEAVPRLWPDAEGVVTADADGQYSPQDILRVARALEGAEGLVLGVRDLKSGDVPRLPRMGSALASVFLRLTAGVRCSDPRTGLRGIPRPLFDLALGVPGQRYDYDIELLTAAAGRKCPIGQLPVRAVRQEGGASRRFRPVWDNLLIYQQPLKYLAVSGGSMAVDLGLFTLLTTLAVVPSHAVVTRATVIARCVSGALNFKLNQVWSFQVKRRTAEQTVKYLLLFLAAMVVSSQATALLRGLPLPLTVIKLMVDVVIFFVNYLVQSRWIFRDKD